jgi:ribonuclease VapC
MIIDTSALFAILAQEEERAAFVEAILTAEAPKISAATLLECSIVVDRQGDPAMSRRVDDLIAALGLHVVPVSSSHAAIGRAAYRDYGKGSGHPAGLNVGDCFAYALARETGEPLLFKGDDFIHTDLTPAVTP